MLFEQFLFETEFYNLKYDLVKPYELYCIDRNTHTYIYMYTQIHIYIYIVICQ